MQPKNGGKEENRACGKARASLETAKNRTNDGKTFRLEK